MYVAVGMPRGERAGRAELRLGGGHREAHGDRVAQPAAAVPALDQGLAVAYAGVRIVAQRLRGVAIHHRLAADDGDAPALRRREEDLGGGSVHGGEDHRGGGAVLHETVEESLGRYARVRRRGVAALLREGEAVQPVEQVPARRGQHPMLRKVDVGVDEARQHQRLAVVVGREGAEPLRQPRRVAAPDDAPVPGDRDRPAAMEPDRALRPDHGGVVAEGQHRAADHPSVMLCAHGVTRFRWSLVMRMEGSSAPRITRPSCFALMAPPDSSGRFRGLLVIRMEGSNAPRSRRHPIFDAEPEDAFDVREGRRPFRFGIVADPGLERGEDRILRRPLHREDEREAEALAVAGVEIVEPGELRGGQPIEAPRRPARAAIPPRRRPRPRRGPRGRDARAAARSAPLATPPSPPRRTPPPAPRDPRTAVRQRRLRRPRANPPRRHRSGRRTSPRRARSRSRSVEAVAVSFASEGGPGPRAGAAHRIHLVTSREAIRNRPPKGAVPNHRIDRATRKPHRDCAASRAPRRARSASVMPVSLSRSILSFM